MMEATKAFSSDASILSRRRLRQKKQVAVLEMSRDGIHVAAITHCSESLR
jgi:hypothetical protein